MRTALRVRFGGDRSTEATGGTACGGHEKATRAGGWRMRAAARSGHDMEIDDDFARVAGQVFELDVFAEMVLQLFQQRQRVVIVAEAHGFTRLQGRQRDSAALVLLRGG